MRIIIRTFSRFDETGTLSRILSQDGEVAEVEEYNTRIDSRTSAQNQEFQDPKQPPRQQQPLPTLSQQRWNSDYGDGPVSMMEVTSGGEVKPDWQPLSLPANIRETYDPNVQYMRSMDESAQYQQPQQQQQQQQDYWNQQSYYSGNYGINESAPSNWQRQSTPGLADQAEIDNAQQQDKWNYEVN